MLKLLLLIPLLGILPLIFIGSSNEATLANRERTNSLMKNIALGTSLINLFISIII
jgi:hypothetical protein